MPRGEPVRRPLPDVPGYVEEPEAVRWERADGRRTHETVALEVLPGKLALPRVRHRATVRLGVVTPRVDRPGQSSSRRVFPLRLRRQLLVRPASVGLRVLVRDMHDRMVFLPVDRAPGAVRVTPRRPRDPFPPTTPVAEPHALRGLAEYDRARDELLRRRVRVVRRVRRALGERHMPRLGDETREVAVRDGVQIHPETVERHAMNRALLRVEALVAHAELAPLDPRHLAHEGQPDQHRSAGKRVLPMARATRRRSGSHGDAYR